MVQEFIEDSKKLNKISIEDANEYVYKLLNSGSGGLDWEINERLLAYQIFDMCLSLKAVGDSSDYHNLAVTFAKINDYDAACDILRLGLKRFPYNIDLLADFIEYGPQSSSDVRFDECEEYFNKLKSIDSKRWTWRAFNFSIDYLFSKMEQNMETSENIQIEINSISKEYIELFPLDERVYFSAYRIEHTFNSENKKYSLQHAMDLPIRAAHCALKLAEIYFNEKNMMMLCYVWIAL